MKFLPSRELERRAMGIITKTKTNQLPVPVELIAHRLGVSVSPTALGEDISGVLVVKEDGTGTIGVNQAHPPVRQRFTVAHEIGHYVLHRKNSGLFIDKEYTAVFRDRRTSKGEDRAEIQANHFASALLMPRRLVLDAIDEHGFDLGDEEALERLAGKFHVSQQAMTFRLSNLGVFPSVGEDDED